MDGSNWSSSSTGEENAAQMMMLAIHPSVRGFILSSIMAGLQQRGQPQSPIAPRGTAHAPRCCALLGVPGKRGHPCQAVEQPGLGKGISAHGMGFKTPSKSNHSGILLSHVWKSSSTSQTKHQQAQRSGKTCLSFPAYFP